MASEPSESQLGLSWHDSAWIPVLNPGNVLEYFSQRTNPFYDRTCNNEVVKMQRLDPSTLQTMTGIEYEVLHVQDPILYVIRKQHRISPTQVTPMADYYMLAGIVYQAPDLCSVFNSRLLSALHHIQAAFSEASSYSRYHPSKGYWWQFKEKQQKLNDAKNSDGEKTKSIEDSKSEPSSLFQREGVHFLLGELSKKFPPQFLQQGQALPGQTKKQGDNISTEDSDPKEGQTTESSTTEVPNGTTVPGGLVTSLSRGLPNPHQSMKRSANGDSVTKQPPGKRKKI
ncbi:mediator of RNA polymerase II transcription subunit 6-like [Acropora muricata]|uniref:mediator of RNA polymerase II transcription subunit 6-like n=1 Tax=Acropora millepora TaxID=45264 RepID=UPI001CF430E9|nr:mediator of RNA polymerase II transcription subunit 6-like [Acropora millepora]